MQLSKLDYDHWCNQVGQKNIKVFKDTVSYYDGNIEIEIEKKNLVPSPIELKIII